MVQYGYRMIWSSSLILPEFESKGHWTQITTYYIFFIRLAIIVQHVVRVGSQVGNSKGTELCLIERAGLCMFPRVAVTKYHILGGLKQQKFLFIQFRRLLPNQGFGRAGSFWELWVESFFSSSQCLEMAVHPNIFWVVAAWLHLCSVLTWCSLSIFVSWHDQFFFVFLSSSYEDTSHIKLGTRPAACSRTAS